MTEEQWVEISRDLLGLWGSGNARIMDARLSTWERRYKLQPYGVVKDAITYLERTCKHWPSPVEMTAAIDEVRLRWERRNASTAPAPKGMPPTAADWREGARLLVRGANDRVRSGRGRDGDPLHRWLLELAEFWETNAERVCAGERPEWPPPPITGAFGGALSRCGTDTGVVDEADRRERRRHVARFEADEREGAEP